MYKLFIFFLFIVIFIVSTTKIMAGQNFHTIHATESARLTKGSFPREIFISEKELFPLATPLFLTTNENMKNGYFILKADASNEFPILLTFTDKENGGFEEVGFPIFAGESITIASEYLTDYAIYNVGSNNVKCYFMIFYNDN